MAKNFTQEQYQKAKEVNILDYLNKNGYQLNKKGHEYCLKEHDSLVINQDRNTWYWHSRQVGGSILQFLQNYENRTLVEAVNILVGEIEYTPFERQKTKYEKIQLDEKGEIILPPKNENNKRVIAYLSKTRGLDFEVINSMIKNNFIYESADKHECVFVSYDENNKVKYANKRSTLTNNNFKQDVSNSSKDYGFKIDGKGDKLFVFESPIDLLSHATISKISGKDFKNDSRISLGGISDKSLTKYLEVNKNIKEIIFFLDNDETGIKNSKNFAVKYGNDYKTSIFSPRDKDLNETLINYRKEKTEKTKLTDYVKSIKVPFITPKLYNSNDIREYFKRVFKSDDYSEFIDRLFDNGILAESLDKKLLMFSKNSDGENICGFEFDIYNYNYANPKILNNCDESNIILNENSNINKVLFLTDNLINFIGLQEVTKTGFVQDLNNIDLLEMYVKSTDIKDICIIVDKPIDIDSNKLNILGKKYDKNISFEKDVSNLCEEVLLKDKFIKKPFISPAIGDNERLFEFLKSNTNLDCNKIVEIFNNKLIYENHEGKAIFLIKDNIGNDVGGIEVDIYNKCKEYKVIENSETKNIFETQNFIAYLQEQILNENELQYEQEY